MYDEIIKMLQEKQFNKARNEVFNYNEADIAEIIEEAIDYWKIDLLTGLNEDRRKAQEKIMRLPDRLQKVAKYIDHKTEKKTFSFDFIYNRAIDL